MKIRLRRAPTDDPARLTGETTVRVTCWRCEHEWDGDKRPADADCFVCGADASPEDHTVHVDEGRGRRSIS